MSNSLWVLEDKKFQEAVKDIIIPSYNLDNVDCISVSNENDIAHIPSKGGCYWIWTNEPVFHYLHKNSIPESFDNGDVIYNGIAKDNINWRIKNHLLCSTNPGWSGISLDLLGSEYQSHRKKCCSLKGKVPFIISTKVANRKNTKKGIKKGDSVSFYERVTHKEKLLKLNFSDAEKQMIRETNSNTYYFKNGINITDEKHRGYEFRVYFIVDISIPFIDYIEKEWRRQYGLPKLCSYSEGR